MTQPPAATDAARGSDAKITRELVLAAAALLDGVTAVARTAARARAAVVTGAGWPIYDRPPTTKPA